MATLPSLESVIQINLVAESNQDTKGMITGVSFAPGEPNYLYVLQQVGKVWKFDLLTKQSELFLDLSPEINALYQAKPHQGKFADERGLLNLIFHPQFNNMNSPYYRKFYVMYSSIANHEFYSEIDEQLVPDPNCMTCISQFTMATVAVGLEKYASEQTKLSQRFLLCFPKPQFNHNGGGLVFDHDENLYIGVGDGGGQNDEHGQLLSSSDPKSFLGFAQDFRTSLGKILRIKPTSNGTYIIPLNNAFANSNVNLLPEIYTLGLRNPWRMSIDHHGNLIVADVGQDKIESIKIVSRPGENLGWRAMEGDEVFNPIVLNYIKNVGQIITPPIITYGRDLGIAIIGAALYEGNLVSTLKNAIVFADYKGNVMYAKEINSRWEKGMIVTLNAMLSSISVDPNGEIYLTGIIKGTEKGVVYKIQNKMISSSVASSSASLSNGHNGLTSDEVTSIVNAAVAKIYQTTSQMRRTFDDNPTYPKMHIAIILRGESQAKVMHSMPDAWDGSVDIAKSKAYSAMAFSSNENALTTRTLDVLVQPGKPLFQINTSNKVGGMITFPGGVPLYKNGTLVGAIGVSGDTVDVDEIVAIAGARAGPGYESPYHIRSDAVIQAPYYSS